MFLQLIIVAYFTWNYCNLNIDSQKKAWGWLSLDKSEYFTTMVIQSTIIVLCLHTIAAIRPRKTMQMEFMRSLKKNKKQFAKNHKRTQCERHLIHLSFLNYGWALVEIKYAKYICKSIDWFGVVDSCHVVCKCRLKAWRTNAICTILFFI